VTFEVFVPGLPRPKGNFSRSPRGGGIYENTPGLPQWTRAVQAAVIPFKPREPLARVPFRVEAVFVFLAPKHPQHPTLMIVKPDADKLLRAIFDALTGWIWLDDSQVASGSWLKRYGAREGAELTISAIEDGQRTLDI
jgi:crossover junction endodeoxyribonuclease RusA